MGGTQRLLPTPEGNKGLNGVPIVTCLNRATGGCGYSLQNHSWISEIELYMLISLQTCNIVCFEANIGLPTHHSSLRSTPPAPRGS